MGKSNVMFVSFLYESGLCGFEGMPSERFVDEANEDRT
jgi:hypothetical protein